MAYTTSFVNLFMPPPNRLRVLVYKIYQRLKMAEGGWLRPVGMNTAQAGR